MKYPFKSLLLAATVLAAASCAKDDTQSGGEEPAGPVIVNASPAAIGGEIILKLKTEASGIVEKSRAQGVSKGSGIDEIDRILNTVNTVRFERLIPDGGRMPAYIVVVASFVTIVEYLMEGFIPALYFVFFF